MMWGGCEATDPHHENAEDKKCAVQSTAHFLSREVLMSPGIEKPGVMARLWLSLVAQCLKRKSFYALGVAIASS